jgi:hypothetical protein
MPHGATVQNLVKSDDRSVRRRPRRHTIGAIAHDVLEVTPSTVLR